MLTQLPVQGGAAHACELHESPPVAASFDAQFAEISVTSHRARGVIAAAPCRPHPG